MLVPFFEKVDRKLGSRPEGINTGELVDTFTIATCSDSLNIPWNCTCQSQKVHLLSTTPFSRDVRFEKVSYPSAINLHLFSLLKT